MTRVRAGRQGGKLLLAAGVLTLVNDYLPGSGHLDLAVLNTVGLRAVALGAVCLRVPWQRHPARAPLLLLLPALGLLVAAGAAGGVSAYSYAVHYVVVFVWLSVAQPPRSRATCRCCSAGGTCWARSGAAGAQHRGRAHRRARRPDRPPCCSAPGPPGTRPRAARSTSPAR